MSLSIPENVNCLIAGEKGIGKTHLLKSLKGVYFSNPNLTVDDLKLITGVNGSMNFQVRTLMNMEKTILLIDNLHEIHPKKKTLLLDISLKHTIISASLFSVAGFEHFHKIELKPLSSEECFKIIEGFEIDDKKKNELVKKCKGNPQKLLRMAEMQSKLGYYSNSEKRKRSLNLYQLTNYLLSIKYFFMFTHQWEVYSLLSMIAYALIGFNRRNRWK